MRIGQPQARLEDDGTFTTLDPTFTDLVMYRKSAERAFEQFRKGDNFIAEGETLTYTKTIDGAQDVREQFVASRIGHDNNITDYTVNRRNAERAPAERDTVARENVQHALAEREAQLDPEPPASESAGAVQREAVTR